METAENVCGIVILGNTKVGKTAILSRFIHGQCPSRHKATGHEVFKEQVAINLSMEIVDMGAVFGKENEGLLKTSLRDADVAIVVVALDDPNCMESASQYHDMVVKYKGSSSNIVIIGNKADLLKKTSNLENIRNHMEEVLNSD